MAEIGAHARRQELSAEQVLWASGQHGVGGGVREGGEEGEATT